MKRALSNAMASGKTGRELLQKALYTRISQLPDAEYFYDTVREEKYGYEPLAYDGHGYCEYICMKLAPYLYSSDCETSLVKRFLQHDFVLTHDSFGQVYSYPRGYGHAYLKVFFEEEGTDIFIDPTYKQLFINKRGPMKKFFSPYAEYLYSLPSVFAGTKQDFVDLVDEIEKRKQLDPYHKNDRSLPLSCKEQDLV